MHASYCNEKDEFIWNIVRDFLKFLAIFRDIVKIFNNILMLQQCIRYLTLLMYANDFYDVSYCVIFFMLTHLIGVYLKCIGIIHTFSTDVDYLKASCPIRAVNFAMFRCSLSVL